MHGARDQVDVRVRHPCPRGEDVALAIAHHGDHGGICQHGLGLLGGRNPTMRLLVLRTTLLMRDLDPPPARPDPSPHQAEAAAAVRVNRHHGMQQQAPPAALGFTQSAPASRYGVEIDLAGVLDRQHMPASRRHGGLITPPLDQPINGHARICEKSPKPNLQRPLPIPQLTHANYRARNHALEKHRPLLSRRRSPNRPNDTFSSNIATLRVDQSVNDRITWQGSEGIPKVHPESLCRTKMCACPSASAGTTAESHCFIFSRGNERRV